VRNRRASFAAFVLAATALTIAADAAPVQAGVSPDARLPDLAVLAPSSIRIVRSPSGRKRLRFTSIVVNIGRGPLQMAGFDDDGHAAKKDILAVRQQILQADGTFEARATTATMFWSGDGHNHWHVTGIQVSRLENLEEESVGPYKKTGFCFMDSYRYTSKKPGVYVPANSVCQTRNNGNVPMGISVKWGDIYPSTIAFQWIDITGLPDGVYRLRVYADPGDGTDGGAFLESDETNNRGSAKIRIKGNKVTVLSRSARP
jgi:hypothetical protein